MRRPQYEIFGLREELIHVSAIYAGIQSYGGVSKYSLGIISKRIDLPLTEILVTVSHGHY